jgi:hypothetical protein
LTLTLADAGQRELSLSGLSFTGADPGDFVITSDGCIGPIAPGESCQLTIQFAPHAPGARSATLQIATNDYANRPLQVPLAGTGGQLPHGPPGQIGQTGAQGPPGPAGKVELVLCQKTKKTTIKYHKKHKTTVQKCSTRLISGTVKFTTGSDRVGATVSRAGITYASGLAVPTGPGHWQLVLKDRRILRPGRYTLTLTTRRGYRRVLERRTITIT